MICERTSYQKQTVSQIIHGLDKQGILHYEIYDSDRRNHIIHLTDEENTYKDLFYEIKKELYESEKEAFPKELKELVL